MRSGVSVIIPNFNNAHWLTRCLESCLAQGEFLKEIIVVDDHSNDGSITLIRDYAKKHSGIIKYFENPGRGANDARNFGFKKSSGNYIQWLDADDSILPGKFEYQINILNQSNADIAYADFKFDFYEGKKYISSEVKKFNHYRDYLSELLSDNWNVTHSYLVTRKFAQRIDKGIGWNPTTLIGQDREYFTMAGILGAKFAYAPGVYAVYNKQNSGTISNMDFNRRLELNQILENRFRREIEKSEIIAPSKKKIYYKILNTHKVKACFYNGALRFDNPISLFAIEWSLVHWKIRILLPFIIVKKNLEHLFFH